MSAWYGWPVSAAVAVQSAPAEIPADWRPKRWNWRKRFGYRPPSFRVRMRADARAMRVKYMRVKYQLWAAGDCSGFVRPGRLDVGGDS